MPIIWRILSWVLFNLIARRNRRNEKDVFIFFFFFYLRGSCFSKVQRRYLHGRGGGSLTGNESEKADLDERAVKTRGERVWKRGLERPGASWSISHSTRALEGWLHVSPERISLARFVVRLVIVARYGQAPPRSQTFLRFSATFVIANRNRFKLLA